MLNSAHPSPDPHISPVQGRVATLQSLSGTGSLRVAADFIAKFLPGTIVYISKPTWGNHKNIFADAGKGCWETKGAKGGDITRASCLDEGFSDLGVWVVHDSILL